MNGEVGRHGALRCLCTREKVSHGSLDMNMKRGGWMGEQAVHEAHPFCCREPSPLNLAEQQAPRRPYLIKGRNILHTASVCAMIHPPYKPLAPGGCQSSRVFVKRSYKIDTESAIALYPNFPSSKKPNSKSNARHVYTPTR